MRNIWSLEEKQRKEMKNKHSIILNVNERKVALMNAEIKMIEGEFDSPALGHDPECRGQPPNAMTEKLRGNKFTNTIVVTVGIELGQLATKMTRTFLLHYTWEASNL